MSRLLRCAHPDIHRLEEAMNERSEELAARFEAAVEEFAAVIEGLSEEQWRTFCPNEERTVAVLARHVAFAIPFEMRVFREIANGGTPATITRDDLATMNAEHADAWADCDRDETLADLRRFAAAAAADVRAFTGEQLARSGKYVADIPEPWTVEQWIERILIGHVTGHLASIRPALASGG
jgi:hypothetical protein